MHNYEPDLPQVYLQPGESFFADQPTIIATILGSCVGVTFWSASLRVGALCHAMLPKCPPHSLAGMSLANGRRYVDFCIHDLAQQFDELGVTRANVQVKLFGGADMLVHGADPLHPSVGKQNSETALELLHAEGYKVTSSSLGDSFGRKIKFNTGTGEVVLRLLI